MPAWPSLQQLHGVFHLTLALQPVSPDFSLSPAYLQSLMMLVVLVLGMGFAMLVLLALFLCLVISFVPPVTAPPLLLRLVVVSVAGSLAFTSYVSMAANDEYADGMNELLRSIDGVGTFSHELELKAVPIAQARDEFMSRVAPLYACELCYRSDGAPNLSNSSVCIALTEGIAAMEKGSTFVAEATAAPARVQHVINLLQRSSGWHAWAASLPCFALLTTCCAIIFGTIRGRRNILVSGQFFAVIIWWMMCAVVSVEFAIAVGLADACLEPIPTVQRVLKQFATERQFSGDMRTYELTMHYIDDCTEPNPLETSLTDMLKGGDSVAAALSNVTRCADSVPPLKDAIDNLRLRVHDGLGGLGTCGRDGAMGKLFQAGVEHGLCGLSAAGITRVFVRQTACGALLLLLTSLLPWLWHSHHLPPLSRRSLVPRFVLYFRWRRVDMDADSGFDAPLMASAIRHADEAAMQPASSLGPEMSMSTPAASQGATTLEHSGGSQASAAERSSPSVSPLDDGRLRACSNHEAL